MSAVVGLGAIAVSAHAAVTLVTVVGGASGMTLDLNPSAAYGLQRGCAPQIIDSVLKALPGYSGRTVHYAYAKARINGPVPAEMEPSSSDPNWKTGQVKFTGDNKDAEVAWIKDGAGNISYAITIRADSVLGMRYVVNQQRIYSWSAQGSPATSASPFIEVGLDPDGSIHYNADGTTNNTLALDNPDFQAIKAHMDGLVTANGGIDIQGGLTEASLDSGIDAIDKYNAMYPAPTGGITQPNLNTTNRVLSNGQIEDNLLSVAVLGVIYNTYVQDNWNGNSALNLTNQMIRLIEGGFVDKWDFFLSNCTEADPQKKLIYNFFREPLSGTAITFLGSCMRGVDTAANGANPLAVKALDNTWNTMYNFTTSAWATPTATAKSGIPNLTCSSDPFGSIPAVPSPGGGEVNKAVQNYYGGIGYTFLQKFTNKAGGGTSGVTRLKLAKVNGYDPYYMDDNPAGTAKNSLPGVNGCQDVTYVRADGKSVFQNVIDGKYPLWTYNHCFARPQYAGTGTGLRAFINEFQNVNNLDKVRNVGLIPLDDMSTFANYRSIPVAGVNRGRGKGIGRCGFVSARTGETVRDGMMMMPLMSTLDANNNVISIDLPGEAYPELRP